MASSARLLCFGEDTRLLWQSEILGADGVLVHEVADGVIHGDAEADPPGGWVPFRIDASSGERSGLR